MIEKKTYCVLMAVTLRGTADLFTLWTIFCSVPEWTFWFNVICDKKTVIIDSRDIYIRVYTHIRRLFQLSIPRFVFTTYPARTAPFCHRQRRPAAACDCNVQIVFPKIVWHSLLFVNKLMRFENNNASNINCCRESENATLYLRRLENLFIEKIQIQKSCKTAMSRYPIIVD